MARAVHPSRARASKPLHRPPNGRRLYDGWVCNRCAHLGQVRYLRWDGRLRAWVHLLPNGKFGVCQA